MLLFTLLVLLTKPDAIEAQLRGHVRFLADDLLEGRDTAERGQRLAARYIAAHFMARGVQPAYPDSEEPYYQVYSLQSREIETNTYLELSGGGEGAILRYMEDFDNITARSVDKSAPITFVGYGLRHGGYDDYAGLDVKGHWVVILEHVPEFEDDSPLADLVPAQKFSWPRLRVAKGMGALGVILLKEELFSFRTFSRPKLADRDRREDDDDEAPFFGIRLQPSKREALFGSEYGRFEKLVTKLAEGKEPRSFTLEKRRLRLSQRAERVVQTAENVVGILPGSDPELADEYVVICAHYDHTGRDAKGINNGADDNASGTAVIMALAENFQRLDHRRSLMLLLVSGEERGLLGSDWFVSRPPVPREQIVANINLDMIGRNAPDKMGLIPNKTEGVSTLTQLAEQVNAELGSFTFETNLDHFFKRSDHYSFVKADIPAVFFFSGLHDDYHKPGDDWHKLNYEKMTRFYFFMEKLVSGVLDADTRPRFLDEDERHERGKKVLSSP